MVTTTSDTHSSQTTVVYFDLGNTLIFGPPNNRQPFADAVSTLQTLYERGYLLGLLSNQADGTTVTDVEARLATYGFGDFIEVITISTELPGNVSKPDPAIFNLALQKAGHTTASARTIFVTETREHISAARNLGWRGILKPYRDSCLQSDGECVATLTDLLDLLLPLEVDLYIRDAKDDPGVDHYTGAVFWNSPDLWVRNSDDGGSSHQAPEFGQDNWLHARITNRGEGIARSPTMFFPIKEFAGTQFVFPDDYLNVGRGTWVVDIEDVAPGESIIVKAKWDAVQIPPEGTHICWLAAVLPFEQGPTRGLHVWEKNNLAQKNLIIVDLVSNDSVVIPFQIGSQYQAAQELYRIEVRRPRKWKSLPISITHENPQIVNKLYRSIEEIEVVHTVPTVQPSPVLRFPEPTRVEIIHRGLRLDPIRLDLGKDSTLDIVHRIDEPQLVDADFSNKGREADLVTDLPDSISIAFRPGLLVGFPLVLRPRSPVKVGLKLTAPSETKPGDIIEINLLQRNGEQQVVGGIAIQMNVVKN